MSRSIATALLALLAAPLGAVDLALPAPERLALHPDGARVLYRLELPAGVHRVRLPAELRPEPLVLGATAWSRVRVPAPPRAAPPAALLALLDERNRVVAAERTLAARAAALGSAQTDLERALSRPLRAELADAAAWQQPLDALLAGRTALDRDQLATDAAREALLAAAEPLVPLASAAAEALALGDGAPLRLDADGLARRWRGLPEAAAAGAALDVTLAMPGMITVVDVRQDVRWAPAAALAIAGGKATLVRRCIVHKPAWLALPRVAAVALTEALHADLRLPTPPAVALRTEAVVGSERGEVATGSIESGWQPAEGQARSEASGATTSEAVSASESPPAEPAVVTHLDAPAPAPARTGLAIALPIGELALPVGTAELTVDADAVVLEVLADEWAVVPELAPVAIRRVDVQLDRLLLAGDLTVQVDGTALGTTRTTEQAAGAVLHLHAGEDDRIFVGTDVPWEVDPATQRRDAQRHGRDRWIWNLGDAPRRLPVYVAMPVSRSDELTVRLDAATTPGAATPEPGVLRWEIELPPGACTRVGAGWIIEASGRLNL